MEMIYTRIQRLKELKKSSYPLLSVYIGVAGEKTPSRASILTLFHSLIHKNLNTDYQTLFKKEILKIERYLKKFNTRGIRSIVFFSSGDRLWEVFEFEFYLPQSCEVSNTFLLNPILEALNSYNRYLVLIVDREKARLFTVFLGKIEEYKDVFDGAVPQKVKHGDNTWDASDKIFRHIEDHLHRHLQLVAYATSEFVKNKKINFIILGGHKTLFSKIKKHLPKQLQKMVLAEFVSELNVPLNKIFLMSKKVAEKIEQEKEYKKMEVSFL